jgi:hypothetical protein
VAFYAVGVSAAVNIVIGYQVVYTICVATRAMQDILWGEPEQSELTDLNCCNGSISVL